MDNAEIKGVITLIWDTCLASLNVVMTITYLLKEVQCILLEQLNP